MLWLKLQPEYLLFNHDRGALKKNRCVVASLDFLDPSSGGAEPNRVRRRFWILQNVLHLPRNHFMTTQLFSKLVSAAYSHLANFGTVLIYYCPEYSGLTLGAIWFTAPPLIRPSVGFFMRISANLHVRKRTFDGNIQRGTKRYVNLAKQDPGKARQSS